MNKSVDKIFFNGKVTTLNPKQGDVTALAVHQEKIVQTGSDNEVMRLAGAGTQVIDLKGRRVVPGLIDSHLHLIRGGLTYNMELRWDGVQSLSYALKMLKDQVGRTPPPQWVRVVGGFSEFQFAERRLPTLGEINAIAPDTPVFILHLYDRALLNAAALRACGYDKDTPEPVGGRIERDRRGNPTGLILAKPNAMILYASLAKGPKLPREYQVNSTRHFMRELNRLGVTGAIDAGGGFQNYPDDYAVVQELARQGELTVRIAYNLFTQHPGGELQDFQHWTKMVKPREGDAYLRHNGAGEMLVFGAADFEDFREPRPDLPASMEDQLSKVVRHLAEQHWPFRLHATYDETIDRALDMFERVNAEVPFAGLHWFFDHAETISARNIDRVKALGGGIAVQHRIAYQGEYFARCYGAEKIAMAPPIMEMLAAEVPVGAGTDATRVASYNPWVSLYWLVAGKTVGGMLIYPKTRCLDRTRALRLWSEANTWFAGENGERGQLRPQALSDFAVLSHDYFSVDEEEIKDITSVLTVVGGRIVHAADEFQDLAPALPEAMPDWAPVRYFGGYQHTTPSELGHVAGHSARSCCQAPAGLLGKLAAHRPQIVGNWNFDCSCWAF